MSDVHLYIDGAQTPSGMAMLDLYENESIALNWNFTEVSNFGVKGSFSREFRVPGSLYNDEVFRGWFNVNASTGTFNHTVKAPSRINVETIQITAGHVQLKKVYLRGENVHEYEIVFFAETPDLATAIGEKKLSQLTALPALNHVVCFANVMAGLADTYMYSLSDRGQRWSEGGETGTRPVFNANRPIYAGDLTPSMCAKWLFDKIIADAGFVWEGWNGQTTLADELELYWHPWIIERWNRYTELAEDNLFEVGYPSDQTGIVFSTNYQTQILSGFTEVFDTGGNVASSIFTAPFDGYYSFDAWATIIVTSGSLPHLTWLKIVDADTGDPLATGPQNQGVTNSFHRVASFNNVFLNAGQRVQMGITMTSCTITLEGVANYDQQTGTGWRLRDMTITSGGTIDMVANAPDFKQIDFIKDIIKLHNLAVIPDRDIPNKIYFEPMETFIGTGTAKDWTGKLDLTKDLVISPTTDLQSKQLKWTYSEGTDAASQLYKKTGNRIYGDFVVEGYTTSPTQNANDFAQGNNEVKLMMQSTPCIGINGTNIVIPKFVNNEGEFQAPGLRILYSAGEAIGLKLWDDDVLSPSPAPMVVTDDVPVLNHYSVVNASLGDDDLNFFPEVPLHEITANPFNNVINKWYRSYLNGIYDLSARMLEGYFLLNLSDVVNFTFADKIWIRDAYWRILNIDSYKVGEDIVCKIVFLKLVNVNADCVYTPDSVSPSGLITFVDGDDVESDGSQVCCERYGYYWSPTSERCYAAKPKKPNTNGYQHALQGWGIQSDNTGDANASSPHSAHLTTGSNISNDATQSVFAGSGIEVEQGNRSMIAVGDTIGLIGEQRSAALFGKNVLAQWPGFHVGGGFPSDVRSAEAQGTAQAGKILFSGEGSFVVSGDTVGVTIEGIPGKHLTLPDNATLAAEFRVVIHSYNIITKDTTRHHYAAYRALIKTNNRGVANVEDITTLFESGDFGTLDLLIDTATETTEYRISVESTSAVAYPYTSVRATIEMAYTQVVTTPPSYLTNNLLPDIKIMALELFISATPAWEEIGDVSVSNAPTRVSFTSAAAAFPAAVVEAQGEMATANATGSPNYNYVIISCFWDDFTTSWTFIMENQA